MGCAVGAGIVVIYAFGILAKEFTAEFGWDRSVFAFCLTSFLIATGFGTVWLGALINRWGVRRPTIAFVAAFAAAVAVLAVLPPSPLLFYVAFSVLGITGAAATAMPYAVAVCGWFDGNRGLALGLVNTGAGLGAVLAPQYASYLVQHYGWRAGILGVAAVVAIVALSALIFLVRDPPSIRAPEATAPDAVRSRAPAAQHFLRERHFWLIAVPVLGISVATFGVMGSLVPLLSDLGIASTMIAAALSTSGLSSWLGRILVGYAMDRVFAPYVAALTFLLALGGIGLIAAGGPPATLLAGAALVGFALGAEGDLVTFLASRYFSLTIYSRVLGALWVMWAWGGGLGTWLVGVTYRATHSYDVSLALFSLVLVVSAVVVCRLGPYVYPREQERGARPVGAQIGSVDA
jgi:MFS family permease